MTRRMTAAESEDGVDELLRRRVLEQESAGSCTQRLVNALGGGSRMRRRQSPAMRRAPISREP